MGGSSIHPTGGRPHFHRGYDISDPVKVGFKEPAPKPTGPFGESRDRYSVFDTKERGNGKEGHAYGMRLPNDEKEKLLEYLKTL